MANLCTPHEFEQRNDSRAKLHKYLVDLGIPTASASASSAAHKLCYRPWSEGMLDLAAQTLGTDAIEMQAKAEYEKKDVIWLRHKCALIRAGDTGNSWELAYRLHCFDMRLPYEGTDGQSLAFRYPVIVHAAAPSTLNSEDTNEEMVDPDIEVLDTDEETHYPDSEMQDVPVKTEHVDIKMQDAHDKPIGEPVDAGHGSRGGKIWLVRLVLSVPGRVTWYLVRFACKNFRMLVALAILAELLPYLGPLYKVLVILLKTAITVALWLHGVWVACRPLLEGLGLGSVADVIEWLPMVALVNYENVCDWITEKTRETVCELMCPCACILARGAGLG
jgi:hypothetical protein